MSSAAQKLIATFERLDKKDQRVVAKEILRRASDDGLEEELRASAAALFRMYDEEEAQSAKR